MLEQYHEYFKTFFKQNVDILLNHESQNHIINFKKNIQTLSFVLYDMNHNETLKFRRYLNENLNKEFIRVNRFETIVFVLFVKKFEENFRFCVNYRDLNVVIVKNKYFLFLIFEILNRFNRVKIVIKFDIIFVFNKLRIREEDKFLIAFRTRFELFEYFVMFFDLCNEFVSFQNYINDIFHEFLNDFYIAYLDNILIYNDNEIEHEFHVKRVFQKLIDASLQINIIKCVFHVTQVFYLNLIITIEKIKMNSIKIDIIVN